MACVRRADEMARGRSGPIDNGAIGHVFGNDGPSSNHCSGANGDAGQDHRPTSNGGAVANEGHSKRSRVVLGTGEFVIGKSCVWPDENMVLQGNAIE